MILADHALWHTGGESLVWLAGIVTALGVLSRTRPVKWLYRQLIGKPVTEWGAKVVGEVVDAKVSKSNGGSSLRDAIEEIRDQQATLVEWSTEAASNQEDMKAALKNLHDCIDNRFADTHARIERLAAYTEEVLTEAVGTKERLRQLYRVLDIPIFETDRAGRCVYVNPAYTNLTGLPLDDALGEGWAEAIHADDRARVFKAWRAAVDDNSEFSAVYRFVNVVTGRVTEVRGTATPMHDGTRQVVGWVGALDPLDRSVFARRESDRSSLSEVPQEDDDA
jgi:PAS domain S-box-containing protein